MSLNPGVTGHTYNLGPVKSWVESAGYLIGNKFNVKTELGWRASDPFPDHPSGHAIDFMISSKAQGQAIADYVVANAGPLGVKYVIWNHQVWEASGKPVAGWHAYTSTSNPHTDHVHVTFKDSPGSGAIQATDVSASTTGTTNSGPNTDPECAWGAHLPITGNVCVASKVQVRSMLAVLLIGTGVVIGLAGIAFLIAEGFRSTGAASAVARLTPVGRLVSRA